MKAYIMRKDLVVAVAVTGILAAVALSSRAEDNPGALAKALPEASVSLDQGLKASEREGKPISGKYEIEDGALHTIPGIDEAAEKAIAAALPQLRDAIPRIPLGRAIAIADPILETLKETPGIDWAASIGSLRRAQDTVGDSGEHRGFVAR